MIQIEHTLKLVSELNPDNSTVKKLLQLDTELQTKLLTELAQKLFTPYLDEINKNGSWAKLRIPKNG